MGLPMIRPFCKCINKLLSDVRGGDDSWLCALYVVSVNVVLVKEVVSGFV
jgi:hypothetical protein